MRQRSSNAELEDRPFTPTKAQARYLAHWLEPDSPDTISGLAALAKVNRRTVYDWFEEPKFCQWFANQVERMFVTHKHRMWKRCLELATAGSPDHIKLVAQRGGELHPEVQGVAGDRHGSVQVFLNVPRPNYQAEPLALDVTPAVLVGQTSEHEH